MTEMRRQLPGLVILVRGNHDRSMATMQEAGFDLVYSVVRIVQNGESWIGRHNPAAFSAIHEKQTHDPGEHHD